MIILGHISNHVTIYISLNIILLYTQLDPWNLIFNHKNGSKGSYSQNESKICLNLQGEHINNHREDGNPIKKCFLGKCSKMTWMRGEKNSFPRKMRSTVEILSERRNSFLRISSLDCTYSLRRPHDVGHPSLNQTQRNLPIKAWAS